MGDASSLILCVEDDPDTQEMLGILIEGRGYRSRAVSTCGEALRLIRENNISALLLDNLLPDGTGIELCRQVRQFNKNLPIIFLSGSAHEGERELALEAGANAFLTKPFSLDELYSILDVFCPAR
jgi:two-component system, OmpR family, response regulator